MNDHQRRQQEMQQAQRKFLQALSAGQVFAVDRFGFKIEPGAKVEYNGQLNLIFDVIGVAPILDPNVPPGMLNVTLSVTFPLQLRANSISPTLIRLPHIEQMFNKPGAAQGTGDDAAEGKPEGDGEAAQPENHEAHDGEAAAGGALPTDEALPAGPKLVLTDPPE